MVEKLKLAKVNFFSPVPSTETRYSLFQLELP